MSRRPQLALSTRIVEHPKLKGDTEDADALVELAAEVGFDALCLRPAILARYAGDDGRETLRRRIRAAGLAVSSVTPSLDVVRHNADVSGSLRDVTPLLDTAEFFGAPLVRVGMASREDVPLARRAADEAAERGITLVHQVHLGSPFETVAGCRETLDAIGRPNFGLVYEPANLYLAAEPYDRSVVQSLVPHVFEVYLQNVRRNVDGVMPVETARGSFRVDHVPIYAPGEVELGATVEALVAAGYAGPLTVHSPAIPGTSLREAAGLSRRWLSERVSGMGDRG
jgi:sugar phosphate isomerase/epimerase